MFRSSFASGIYATETECVCVPDFLIAKMVQSDWISDSAETGTTKAGKPKMAKFELSCQTIKGRNGIKIN